jgi:hypothetical protein
MLDSASWGGIIETRDYSLEMKGSMDEVRRS